MIEKYENVNKIELRKYEGQTIRNTKCVNKRIEVGLAKGQGGSEFSDGLSGGKKGWVW